MEKIKGQGYTLFKRPGSPYWWYGFKLPGQPRVRVTTKSADEKYAHKAAQIARGQALEGKIVKKSRKVLFSVLLKEYLELRWPDPSKRKQQDAQTKPLLEYFGQMYASEIAKKHVEQYKAKRETHLIQYKHKAPKLIEKTSINKELTYARAAYNQAIGFGELNDNPFKGGRAGVKTYTREEKENQRTRFLNQQEKDTLLGGIKRHLLLYQIAVFALRTGMRRGEILNLKWTSVDWQNAIITVEKSKGGNKRHMPMHKDDVYDVLMSRRSIPSDYVFSYGGKRVSEHSFKNTFRRWVDRLGIPDLHFHDLRHTFAADYLMLGGTLRGLAEALGHTTLRMTMRYAHLSKEFMKESIMVLPSLTKKHGNGNVHKIGTLEVHPFTHPRKIDIDEELSHKSA